MLTFRLELRRCPSPTEGLENVELPSSPREEYFSLDASDIFFRRTGGGLESEDDDHVAGIMNGSSPGNAVLIEPGRLVLTVDLRSSSEVDASELELSTSRPDEVGCSSAEPDPFFGLSRSELGISTALEIQLT